MKCLAYNAAGTICGKPAIVLDKQRGCMVCAEHGAQAIAITGRVNGQELRPPPPPPDVDFKRRLA